MNAFQWVSLTLLAALLIVEIVNAFRGQVRRRLWLLRVATWTATAIAIARPDQLTKLAQTLGITTGANLVSYLSVLLFFGVSLFLYARSLKLQQQLTEIVRHIAIRDAEEPETRQP